MVTKKGNKKQKQATRNGSASRVQMVRRVAAAPAPLAMGSIVRQQPGNQIRVCHTELLATVNNTIGTGFNVQHRDAIQPGTFRWLGPIAQRYEQYRVHKLKFTYLPSVPTTDAGNCIIMFDADVKDTVPSGLNVMLQSQFSTLTPVWKTASIVIKDEGILNPVRRHYTRGAEPPTPYDHKTYDVGQMFVATDGASTSPGTKGHIMLEYDLTLYNPGINEEQGGHIDLTKFNVDGSYTYPEYGKFDGKVPLSIDLPNDDEIADGAVPGQQVLRLLDDAFHQITLTPSGTGITSSMVSTHKGSGVALAATDFAYTPTKEVFVARMKKNDGALPNTGWFQPRFANSTFSTLVDAILTYVPASRNVSF